MIFTPNFSATESNDGKTITFTNTSNFDTNDQGYTRNDFTTNRLVLKDAYGALLDTIDFPTAGLDRDKITFSLDKDKWIDAELQMDSPGPYSKTSKFPFYKMFIQKYKSVLS